MITVEFDDRAIIAELQRVERAAINLSPALRAIGEKLTESTKHRFVTTTAPDGTPWAADSQVTIEKFLWRKTGIFDEHGKLTGTKKGYYLKGGQLGVKGARLVAGKKTLTDGGALGESIDYQVHGNDSVEIGSPEEYAAMMHFGGTKIEFPHLWGDIPARKFLGVSTEDEDVMLSILRNYLESAI